MKLCVLLISFAFGQEMIEDNENDYELVDGILERKKKKDKLDYADPYASPTTPSYQTTTPKKTTTTQPKNPYGSGMISAYGDPHFHIVGISESQPDLCFDYNATPGDQLVLLADSESGLNVTGTLFAPVSDKGVYFESIQIRSPHAAILTVDGNGWDVSIPADVIPMYDWVTETLKYGDMTFGEFHKHGGIDGTKRMDVAIPAVGTFQVSTSSKHGNVNIKILDSSRLSENITGILGQFLVPGSYQIQASDVGDENKAFLLFNGKVTEVQFKRHAWNKNCWTLSEADFLELAKLT